VGRINQLTDEVNVCAGAGPADRIPSGSSRAFKTSVVAFVDNLVPALHDQIQSSLDQLGVHSRAELLSNLLPSSALSGHAKGTADFLVSLKRLGQQPVPQLPFDSNTRTGVVRLSSSRIGRSICLS